MHIILGMGEVFVGTAIDDEGRPSVVFRKKKHGLPVGETLPEGMFDHEVHPGDTVVSFENLEGLEVLLSALEAITIDMEAPKDPE